MNILLFLFILHTVHGEFGTSNLKDRRLMDVGKEKNYYVVELMDPPSQMEVDQYVCVPDCWLVLRDSREMVDIAAVKYPIENASVTKQRVKKREVYSDDWMIFVANVKYATDSYKDAKNYIKILNKILSQERNSGTNDPETSQAHVVCNAEPNHNVNESELMTLPNSDVEACENHTNVVETLNNASKRYFTRQSRKMYATDKLSEAISIMSLDISLGESPMESNDSLDEGTTAKDVENTELIDTNNQESQNASLRDELVNEQIVDSFRTIHNLSSITGLALEEHNVLKRLEEITISIKKSINNNATKGPSQIKLPVFGADFVGLMQNLYCQFERCQSMLFNLHKQYVENCSTAKKIIELVNTLNTMNVNSNDTVEKEPENVLVDEKIDEDVEVISDTESDNEEKPQGAQIQNIINTVVQKSFDATIKHAKTDDQISNEIGFEPLKFTLPPEYDPEDSKWTLRYRKKQKDLVELIPNSGVYINAIKLGNCKRISRESKTLARMLMLEIFSDNALKTCSLTGKRANAFYTRDERNVRPGLDQHARMVLMNFVDEYAKENNWLPISTQAVVDSMRNKLQELRVKSSQRKNK